VIVCRRCIYDERIPRIRFDADGICNYCHQHDQQDRECPVGPVGQAVLERMASDIRAAGRSRKYDVVVGVSGGCDSSYLLYLAKTLGLRPLAVHFDNTWNSRTAVQNLRRILAALDVDLYTHVVDHREYNDLFRAFLRASVPEVDTPTDIALAVTHYLAARRYGVRYIWEGHSFRTEGISPPGWFYMDARYIAGIHRRFGTVPLDTFPNLWLGRWLKWIVVDGIRKLRPLYYVDYRKLEARALLERNFGWQWYGGHHMENRTAQFTNNYYLPRKFGIDLRYSEFSALVRSGQMARGEALARIAEPKPFDPAILAEVKKRLQLGDAEFEAIMSLPPKSYRDYPTYKQTFERMRPFFWVLYKGGFVPKSFYLKYARNP
jgi:N-acetyl sugar amidotransferase